MNDRIKFGLIGSGWRAEYYLRIARFLPEIFEVCGVVSRSEAKRGYIKAAWGVNTYGHLDGLLDANQLDFVVISVAKDSAHLVIRETAAKGIPLLAETPPANNLADLIALNSAIGKQALVQVAEQYHLFPMHAARQALIDSGVLGTVGFAHVSISHGYHGVSLIRKMLKIGFENAAISATHFEFPGIEGPGRKGLPEAERITPHDHVLAILDFHGTAGLYDFEKDQHRSFIRSNRILVRGARGEINGDRVKHLVDFRTPLEFPLERINAGEEENLEGYYLKGILAGGRCVYRNPFIPGRLSDDEIAVATALQKMAEYVKGGPSFYSLAEASQDQYLALMIEEAVRQEKSITTETQCWAG